MLNSEAQYSEDGGSSKIGGGYSGGLLKGLFDAQPNRNSGIRTSKYEYAMADLTRKQWEDFKTRYLPEQDKLIGLATSDQLLNEQMDRNEKNINTSFDTAKKNESMRMGRYGLTPDNSTQDNNNNNLLKNLTTASVNNETRSAVDELQTKIMTGQGGTPRSLADIGGGK